MSKKALFKRVLDSIVEGRSQQAKRYVDEYLKTHPEFRKRGE